MRHAALCLAVVMVSSVAHADDDDWFLHEQKDEMTDEVRKALMLGGDGDTSQMLSVHCDGDTKAGVMVLWRSAARGATITQRIDDAPATTRAWEVNQNMSAIFDSGEAKRWAYSIAAGSRLRLRAESQEMATFKIAGLSRRLPELPCFAAPK